MVSVETAAAGIGIARDRHSDAACSTPSRREIRAHAVFGPVGGRDVDVAPRHEAERLLTTVLITDIVESTRTAMRLGDREWRGLLDGHYADCRAAVDRMGGELIGTTGDGIVAIFDLPTHAVRAAAAIQALARESGIAVRAGIHTGECERTPEGLAGVAVHVAARVCALGGPEEVLATRTVRDVAMGSRLSFEPRGYRELRGVPGNWTVFRATVPAAEHVRVAWRRR
jgi:class 3 adenylate cyclase